MGKKAEMEVVIKGSSLAFKALIEKNTVDDSV